MGLQRKENEMKYLGIMNGWKETPAEYTQHLAECGTEYETTICYMEYGTKVDADGNRYGSTRRQRQDRGNLQRVRLQLGKLDIEKRKIK